MSYLTLGIMGGLGGTIRALVGVRKALLDERRFSISYFLSTIINAIIIGIIVGAVLGTSTELALVAGYAGTDLLEGLAKSLKLFPLRVG